MLPRKSQTSSEPLGYTRERVRYPNAFVMSSDVETSLAIQSQRFLDHARNDKLANQIRSNYCSTMITIWRDGTPSSPENLTAPQSVPPVIWFQCAETMGPVSQRHVHPANRPISHPRDETVLLFRSTPSSNSVDRKSHAPPSAIPAKSKSR